MPANQQLRRRNHILWERLISTASDAELRTLHEIAVTELRFRNLKPLGEDYGDEPEPDEFERRGTGQHRIPADEEEPQPQSAREPSPPARQQRTTGPTGEVLVRRPGRPSSNTEMRRVTGR